MIINALFNFLKDQPEVFSVLGRYDFGDGNLNPCIFTGEVPDDAAFPVARLATEDSTRDETRAVPGAKIMLSLRLFFPKGTSPKYIRDSSYTIWRLIRTKTDLETDSRASVILITDPPVDDQDDFGFPGANLVITAFYSERSE